jgi:hypothetical protein
LKRLRDLKKAQEGGAKPAHVRRVIRKSPDHGGADGDRPKSTDKPTDIGKLGSNYPGSLGFSPCCYLQDIPQHNPERGP